MAPLLPLEWIHRRVCTLGAEKGAFFSESFMDWGPNSIYFLLRRGFNRTQILKAARRNGEPVDLKRTIERLSEDPTIILVMDDGEEFHFSGNRFWRINPIKNACSGMIQNLQI